jgi:hypothetical protein
MKIFFSCHYIGIVENEFIDNQFVKTEVCQNHHNIFEGFTKGNKEEDIRNYYSLKTLRSSKSLFTFNSNLELP